MKISNNHLAIAPSSLDSLFLKASSTIEISKFGKTSDRAILPLRLSAISKVNTSELIASGRIIRIYLDELPKSKSIGINIAQLITIPRDGQAIKVSLAAIDLTALPTDVVNFIETVLVSKFPKLTREEIEKMFTLDDLRQTRIYQDAQQEGLEIGLQRGKKVEAEQLILRLLRKRFKNLTNSQVEYISALDLEQLENLGEAFLDFSDPTNLDEWLDSQI